MSNRRISMLDLKRILELKAEGKSDQYVSMALGVSKERVNFYFRFFRDNNITAIDIKEISNEELFELLDSGRSEKIEITARLQKNFPQYKMELKRTGVTLKLLWKEFQESEKPLNSEGYSYSRFCYLYRIWCDRCDCYAPLHHKAGDKMFVDYAGDKIRCKFIGLDEDKRFEVFVSILPASEIIYAEATVNQKTECFIPSLENALGYYGGVPELIVCDNMKTAVTVYDRYQPDFNQNFERVSLHYGCSGFSTRVKRPKDKALVESAVNIVYQNIYAVMRDEVFNSLEEVNKRIRELLDILNCKKLTGCDYSRRELFDEIEAPVLKQLPVGRYELKKFQDARVRKNGHVFLSEDKKYYSVPYEYYDKKLKIIYDSREVEIMNDFSVIAYYQRCYGKQKYITNPAHQHPEKQFRIKIDELLGCAAKIGNDVYEYLNKIVENTGHQIIAEKQCRGILHLAQPKKYGVQRVSNACRKAAYCNNYSYRIIKSILEKNLDSSLESTQIKTMIPDHENIRIYYT